MNRLHLVAANLGRRKIRTLLTVGSILVAFFLLGLLGAVQRAFSMGVEVAGVDRLVMIHKVSLVQPLPVSYRGRIEATEGVDAVVPLVWFGGTYQDPKNFFSRMVVEPEAYLDMYPEFLVSDQDKARWLATRDGVLVGRTLVEKYGWSIGDRIPIIPDIWPHKDGGPWEFEIAAIYDGAEPGTDTAQFLMRYDYFDEGRSYGEGLIGWYTIRVEDPAQSAEIAAKLDGMFANSAYETKTSTEKAFVQGFANQVGDIGKIVGGILVAVFFTILLVAGTTMAQSVRERTAEIGVMKAMGFVDGSVLALVLAESMLIALLGAGLGLGLAVLAIAPLKAALGEFLALTHVPTPILVLGGFLAIALGLIAGGPPAWSAMKLRVADALRRN